MNEPIRERIIVAEPSNRPVSIPVRGKRLSDGGELHINVQVDDFDLSPPSNEQVIPVRRSVPGSTVRQTLGCSIVTYALLTILLCAGIVAVVFGVLMMINFFDVSDIDIPKVGFFGFILVCVGSVTAVFALYNVVQRIRTCWIEHRRVSHVPSTTKMVNDVFDATL